VNLKIEYWELLNLRNKKNKDQRKLNRVKGDQHTHCKSPRRREKGSEKIFEDMLLKLTPHQVVLKLLKNKKRGNSVVGEVISIRYQT